MYTTTKSTFGAAPANSIRRDQQIENVVECTVMNAKTQVLHD
jgi:hypothetical protein